MYVIQVKRRIGTRNVRYIAGIFADVTARRLASQAIPLDIRKDMTLENSGIPNYPLYLVETDDGFLYYSKAGIQSFLEGAAHVITRGDASDADSFEPLFNVYVVASDFEPGTPGIDEMGALSHTHVTRDDLTPRNIRDFVSSLA